jgi:hypothetical protein
MWHINLPSLLPAEKYLLKQPSNTFTELDPFVNATTGNYINLAIVHPP